MRQEIKDLHVRISKLFPDDHSKAQCIATLSGMGAILSMWAHEASKEVRMPYSVKYAIAMTAHLVQVMVSQETEANFLDVSEWADPLSELDEQSEEYFRRKLIFVLKTMYEDIIKNEMETVI